MDGTRTVNISPNIKLVSISPEAHNLLELALDGWDEHRQGLPQEYQNSVYSFAYWLFRYSGLVEPASPQPAQSPLDSPHTHS